MCASLVHKNICISKCTYQSEYMIVRHKLYSIHFLLVAVHKDRNNPGGEMELLSTVLGNPWWYLLRSIGLCCLLTSDLSEICKDDTLFWFSIKYACMSLCQIFRMLVVRCHQPYLLIIWLTRQEPLYFVLSRKIF